MKSAAKLTMTFAGFGILLGLMQGLLLSESLFASVGLRRLPNDAYDMALLLSYAATSATVGVLGVRGTFEQKRLPAGWCAACALAGTTLLAVSGSLRPLAVLAGALTGSGAGGLALSWQEALAWVPARLRVFCVGSAFLCVFAVSSALVAFPSPIAMALCFAGIPASALLLAVCCKNVGLEPGRVEVATFFSVSRPSPSPVEAAAATEGTVRSTLSQLLGPLFCLAAFATVFGIVGQVAIGTPRGFSHASQVTCFSIGCAAALFLAVSATSYKAIDPSSVFRTIFPLALAALFLLPFIDPDSRAYGNGFLAGGYFFVSFAFMVLTASAVRNLHVSSYVVNGFSRGMETALSVVGVAVGTALSGSDGYDFIQTVTLVFLCGYLLSTALLLLSRQTRKEKEPARGHPERKESVIIVNEVVRSADDQILERCSACAKAHGLTQREEEVLFYLAKGRSSSYISELFVVSLNTVKGHVKNIYAKTGVHSKQELLDLVERSGGAVGTTGTKPDGDSAQH
ncbi:response regulator transcription factor [Rubneribacter sp.]|nr:helix-turn-helix transcriptional regulator [Candidatus Rubneribacter avistercoris]